MTTNWEPEAEYEEHEEQGKSFSEADWQSMTIAERVTRAQECGLSGKLGSKLWEDLTPGEKTTIIHPEERPAVQEYQIKAHVALEDSDGQPWGILKDTNSDFNWKPGDGQIVGTWSRSPKDGLIHVFLETPITALVDKATQRFAEYAEKRRQEPASAKTRAPRTPKVKAPVEPTETAEELQTLSRLRDLFKR